MKTEKTRHELLSETLQKSAQQWSELPTWVKNAVSTERIFDVAPPRTTPVVEHTKDQGR